MCKFTMMIPLAKHQNFDMHVGFKQIEYILKRREQLIINLSFLYKVLRCSS